MTRASTSVLALAACIVRLGSTRASTCAPLDYLLFIAAMDAAHAVLSYSSGLQEEAPAFGKPVFVLRDETERPEAVAAGVARLV